jgi:hypothetical protein
VNCFFDSSVIIGSFAFFSPKILWENRLKKDVGNDCLASVDGTGCPIVGCILPNGRDDPHMDSYKIRCSALRYEVAVSICSSDIVWVAEPYLPGQWNDLMIFRHGLSDMLPPGE